MHYADLDPAMPSDIKKKWWVPALNWGLMGLIVYLLASSVVPEVARQTTSPFLSALAQHTFYLYWACGLMLVVGVVDSALLYRQQRKRRE